MTFQPASTGNPNMRTWGQHEDMMIIAGAVLGISAPEMADRYLTTRTAAAINMRLTHIRKRDQDSGSSAEIGSRNLLVAMLRWAVKNDTVPPGLTYVQLKLLCEDHGIDLVPHGLNQLMAG